MAYLNQKLAVNKEKENYTLWGTECIIVFLDVMITFRYWRVDRTGPIWKYPLNFTITAKI